MHGVTERFGTTVALDDAVLSFPHGSICGLVGYDHVRLLVLDRRAADPRSPVQPAQVSLQPGLCHGVAGGDGFRETPPRGQTAGTCAHKER